MPKLLLVEDNPADVRIICEALAEGASHCEIEVAINGEQALQILFAEGQSNPARPPDLILLDLNLPRINGHEVLRRIKQHENLCRIPVIILTSSELPTDVQEAYSHGANSYFCKPVDLEAWQALAQTVALYWLNFALLPMSPMRK